MIEISNVELQQWRAGKLSNADALRRIHEDLRDNPDDGVVMQFLNRQEAFFQRALSELNWGKVLAFDNDNGNVADHIHHMQCSQVKDQSARAPSASDEKQRGSIQHDNHASDKSDLNQTLEQTLSKLMQPFKCGGGDRPLSYFNPKEIVDLAFINTFNNRDIPNADLLEFYTKASIIVIDFLLEYANARRAAGSDDTAPIAQGETTIACAHYAPLKMIAECSARIQLGNFNPKQALLFDLEKYAGRNVEEIATLVGEDVSSIETELDLAKIEIQIAAERNMNS